PRPATLIMKPGGGSPRGGPVMFLPVLCIAAVGAALFAGAQGGRAVTGVGLDWRHRVFVQEYWKDGRPQYLIANDRDEPIALTVHRWERRAVGPKLAGPWAVAAHATARVEAGDVKDGELVAFVLADQTLLGLLRPPAARPPHEGEATKGTILTTYGLNGSGGN